MIMNISMQTITPTKWQMQETGGVTSNYSFENRGLLAFCSQNSALKNETVKVASPCSNLPIWEGTRKGMIQFLSFINWQQAFHQGISLRVEPHQGRELAVLTLKAWFANKRVIWHKEISNDSTIKSYFRTIQEKRDERMDRSGKYEPVINSAWETHGVENKGL